MAQIPRVGLLMPVLHDRITSAVYKKNILKNHAIFTLGLPPSQFPASSMYHARALEPGH